MFNELPFYGRKIQLSELLQFNQITINTIPEETILEHSGAQVDHPRPADGLAAISATGHFEW